MARQKKAGGGQGGGGVTATAEALVAFKKPRKLACQFGNVGFGDAVVSISVRFDRAQFADANDADELLCERRLKLVMLSAPEGTDPNQKMLFEGMELPKVTGVFDTSGCRGTGKHFSTRLALSLAECEGFDPMDFAKRPGVISIEEIGDVAKKKRGRPRKDGANDADTDEL